jgi:hypothetical protein
VTRSTLEALASGGGDIVRVVTSLDSAPVAGQALSTAIGDGADALAAQAGGSTTYVANIPTSLVHAMESAGLAARSTTTMGDVTGTELQFQPQATEFVVQFFHPIQ